MIRTLKLVGVAMVLGACDRGPDATPATIVVRPPTVTSIMSGATLTLAAAVANASGQVLAGWVVTWQSSDPNVAAVSEGGIVTGHLVGIAQVTAFIGEIHSAPVSVRVEPGTATQLALRTQPGGGASGQPLAIQPVVQVQDAAGNVVVSSSATVAATIASGNGTLTGDTAVAVGGTAAFAKLTISGASGDRTLVFAVPGLTSVTSIGFAIGPGKSVRLTIRTEPSGATSGSPMLTQPVVEIRDEAGNIVTEAGDSVTAALESGGGTLTGAAVPAMAGVATFVSLTASGAAGPRTIVFTSPGLTSVVSNAFLLSQGPASRLRIATQPGGASAGIPLIVQPVVEAVDDAGNRVVTSTTAITSTVTGATVIDGASSAAVGGIARFDNLTIGGQVGQYALTFSSLGLAPVTSQPFSLGPGTATRLEIDTQPGGAVDFTPLQTQPIVSAYDAFDNLAVDHTGTVSAAVASGFAILGSAATAFVDGIARFQLLTVSAGGSLAPVTLMFYESGLSKAISEPFLVAQTADTHIVVQIAPPEIVNNGVPMAPQPVVEVRDASDALVMTPVVVTFETDAPTGTIVNGTATTLNGIASFSGLTLSGPLGDRNYVFKALTFTSIVFRVRIDP